MNDRGVLNFLMILLFVLLFGLIAMFLFFNPESKKDENGTGFMNDSERVTCQKNSDCEDEDACVLNYCNENGFCVDVDVVLCYQNDGCCPRGCTPQNDNDCS